MAVLPLAHAQLLLLVWHSLSESTRGELLARAASVLCAAVGSAAANSRQWGAPQWLALHRCIVLTSYMLRHLDAVPSHLAPQLQAQLLNPPPDGAIPFVLGPLAAGGVGGGGGAAVLASAVISFEPLTGRLRFGSVVCGGVASPMTAVDVATGSPGISHVSRGGPAALTFSTSLVYEVASHSAGVSSIALAALRRHASICAPHELHTALQSLVDVLHAAPPRAATPLGSHSASGPPRAIGSDSAGVTTNATAGGIGGGQRPLPVEGLAVLGAHSYHLAWRMLASLPPPSPPQTPMADRAEACTIHEVRGLLRLASSAPLASGGPDAAACDAALVRCAQLLSAIASGTTHAERSTALASALSLCIERLVTSRCGRHDVDAKGGAAAAADADGEGGAAASVLASPADVSGVLAFLASAISSLSSKLRATSVELVPPQLADDAPLATAAIACGIGGSRLTSLLAALAAPAVQRGGAMAARPARDLGVEVALEMERLGEPLPLLKLSALTPPALTASPPANDRIALTAPANAVASSGGRTPASAGGDRMNADEDLLLSALLTHIMAPLTVAPPSADPPSRLSASVGSGSGSGASDTPSHRAAPRLTGRDAGDEGVSSRAGGVSPAVSNAAERERKEAAAAASVAVAVANAAATAVAASAAASRAVDSATDSAEGGSAAAAEALVASAERAESLLFLHSERARREREALLDADIVDVGEEEDDDVDDEPDDGEEGEEEDDDDPHDDMDDAMEAEAIAAEAAIHEAAAEARAAEAEARAAARAADADKTARAAADAAAREAAAAAAAAAAATPSASSTSAIPSSPVGPPLGRRAHRPPTDAQAAATIVHATLQLALHDVLRATLTVMHALETPPPSEPSSAGTAEGTSPPGGIVIPVTAVTAASHPLVHALLPLAAEPLFAFVKSPVRALLALNLPDDAARCYADVLQLRRIEAFLARATAHLAEAKSAANSHVGGGGGGAAARAREITPLTDLISECVDTMEGMSRSATRQKHLALFYTGVTTDADAAADAIEPSAADAAADAAAGADADADADAQMDTGDATADSPVSVLGRAGDLAVLMSILRGPCAAPGTLDLSAQVLALLLRILHLAHPLPPPPRMYAHNGVRLVAQRVTPHAHLTTTLLAMDPPLLGSWLHERLHAGPLQQPGTRGAHSAAATAALESSLKLTRSHVHAAAHAAGGGDFAKTSSVTAATTVAPSTALASTPGGGVGAGSAAAKSGAAAAAASGGGGAADEKLCVWALVAELIRILVPTAESADRSDRLGPTCPPAQQVCHLPASPRIYPDLLVSPRISPYHPVSPRITPYHPVSPHISLNAPISL